MFGDLEVTSNLLDAGDCDRGFIMPCLLGFGIIRNILGYLASVLIISRIACEERVDFIDHICFRLKHSLRTFWLRRFRSEVAITYARAIRLVTTIWITVCTRMTIGSVSVWMSSIST